MLEISSSSSIKSFKKLPPCLLLQLDNCGSENKNRYVFAYLSLLVAKQVLMIEMGFLMIGHTHEDIDAMFSCFSEQLRTSHIVTLPHLMKTFNECTSCTAKKGRKSGFATKCDLVLLTG